MIRHHSSTWFRGVLVGATFAAFLAMVLEIGFAAGWVVGKATPQYRVFLRSSTWTVSAVLIATTFSLLLFFSCYLAGLENPPGSQTAEPRGTDPTALMPPPPPQYAEACPSGQAQRAESDIEGLVERHANRAPMPGGGSEVDHNITRAPPSKDMVSVFANDSEGTPTSFATPQVDRSRSPAGGSRIVLQMISQSEECNVFGP